MMFCVSCYQKVEKKDHLSGEIGITNNGGPFDVISTAAFTLHLGIKEAEPGDCI